MLSKFVLLVLKELVQQLLPPVEVIVQNNSLMVLKLKLLNI